MNEYPKKGEAVDATLRRVERLPTVSPFSRAFYRYLNSLMAEVGANDARLGQAFHLFLRVECRRHESAGRLDGMGEVPIGEVIRTGKESHFLLDRLSRSLQRMEVADGSQAVACDLLLAECNYHLGRTGEVIQLLKRAMRMGCHHPLVHFALGYNTYSSALRRFTKPGPHPGELIAHDPRALDRAFREAIRAFEGGLGDEMFDAQIHWWIGMVHEMRGEIQAACDAYEQALEADPEQFGERVTEKLRRLKFIARRSPKEAERLDRLGPITDKDILSARFEMGQPEFFHTFFPDPER